MPACSSSSTRTCRTALLAVVAAAVLITIAFNYEFSSIKTGSGALPEFSSIKTGSGALPAPRHHAETSIAIVESSAPELGPLGATRTGSTRDPPKQVPIIITAIHYQLTAGISTKTIPFMCKANDRVVILTTTAQPNVPDAPCLEVVRVHSKSPFAPASIWSVAPRNSHQRVFFERWYLLKNWMRQTNTDMVFALDSDALLLPNITEFVQKEWAKIKEHVSNFARQLRHHFGPFLARFSAPPQSTRTVCYALLAAVRRTQHRPHGRQKLWASDSSPC